jgi:hypothetical protein
VLGLISVSTAAPVPTAKPLASVAVSVFVIRVTVRFPGDAARSILITAVALVAAFTEMQVAKSITFQPGTMLVFDRGYPDHDWWLSPTRSKVDFVTRLKISNYSLRSGCHHRSWRVL